MYLEVARRAGLLSTASISPVISWCASRCRAGPLHADDAERLLIIDPFHGGATLSENDCRQLLRQHVGDEAAFDTSLLEPATRLHIVTRMLVNLKRLYVRMRSFPQARFVSDLLLTIDPSAIAELRDRGLLAYHLEDFAAALRDLETYLRLRPRPVGGAAETIDDIPSDDEDSGPSHDAQIWEHVKTLRKRVAGMN